jgi:hypothetical protein
MNVETGPVASRRIVFTVGEHADESAAAWRWAAQQFLEPQRDELLMVHFHTGSVVSLVRAALLARSPVRGASLFRAQV